VRRPGRDEERDEVQGLEVAVSAADIHGCCAPTRRTGGRPQAGRGRHSGSIAVLRLSADASLIDQGSAVAARVEVTPPRRVGGAWVAALYRADESGRGAGGIVPPRPSWMPILIVGVLISDGAMGLGAMAQVYLRAASQKRVWRTISAPNVVRSQPMIFTRCALDARKR